MRSIVAGVLCLAGVAQGADLPVKFLEYVESTGEQYVDTGYVPNNDTRIVADFQLVQLGQARNYVFGEYKVIGSITYGRCQFSPGAQMFVGCGGGSKTKTIAWEEDTDWHTVALTNDTVWLDGASVYKGEGIGGNATSLYLFANNGSGTASDFATNRIGLVRIHNSGTIQRLMVPCEMGDGRVGFWDFVGGTFYGNAVVGGANFVGGPEVASPLERLEYVKFASGAYLDTGIVPSNHETAIRFRDEKSAPGGYLFGLAINGDQWYYSFRSEGTAWLWYYSGRSTRGGGIYSANVDHTVVYNDVQGGLVFMDGLSLGKAIDVTPANKLWLGRMYQTYNYEGRIYWVKVTARDTGDVALWLEPMRILGLVGFYNPATGKLLLQSAGTLSAGPLQAGQFEIAAQRGVEVKGMSPVCGLYENLTNGEERVVSAPAETLVAPEFKVTVTGWKLYEWSDEAMDWVYNADRADASGTGTSFTYVHSGVATKLVWQSSLSNPSAAGGELYVTEFGDDDADGKSWETAKQTVGAAFGALGTEGGKVCVNYGHYWVDTALTLDRAITLVGVGNADGKRPTIEDKNGESKRLLDVSHADARVENLRLYKGYINYNNNAGGGGGLRLTAGAVVNCEFADCYSAGERAGGSVVVTGGTLSRCSVHGGYTVNGNGNGSGAYVNGANAVVEHCLFYGNSQNGRQGATSKIGAVYLNAGTVRNCTIVNNNMGKAGGIYVANGAKFYDSIVWGNVSQNDTTVGAPNWQMASGAYVTNICTTVAMGVTTGGRNLTAYPNFKDLAANDCRLMPGSPCIDAGSFAYPADALDLAGNPRTTGTATDLGAYELDANEKAVGIEYSITGNLPGETLTYSVVSTGFGGEEIAAYWNFSDVYPTAEAHDAEGLSGNLTLQAGIYSISLTVVSGGEEYHYQVKSGFTVYGLDMKVVDGNPNAKPPYDTWANAAANVADAVALATDGTVITLSNGTHKLTKPIDFSKAFTVQGLTGDPNDVTVSGQGARLCADVKCDGAVIRDIRLYNGNHNQGGVVSLTANARVDHCIIDTGSSGNNSHGGCVYMTSGTISRSIIKNGKTTNGSGDGDGIYMTGGVVEHSLIIDNKSAWSTGKRGGGVYAAGGLIRNCTIYGNTGSVGGGVYLAGGKMIDSIVWGNKRVDGGETDKDVYGATTTTVTNTWCSTPIGTVVNVADPENFFGDPGFVDAANGDFTLGASSKCKDAAWGPATVEHDLAGSNRVQGAAMDLGCYEADPNTLAVDFGSVRSGEVDAVTNVLTLVVSPEGTDLSNATAYWTFDGRTPTVADHDAEGLCVTNVFGAGGHSVGMLAVVNDRAFDPVVKEKFFKVYASLICMDAANVGHSAKPWNDWTNAATNVNEITDYLTSGSVVLLKPGRYPLAATVNLTADITFRGVAADGVSAPAYGERPTLFPKSGGGNFRAFVLGAEKALIEHLALTGFSGSDPGGGYGGTVRVTQGTVAGCSFLETGAASNTRGGALGLNGANAVAERCVFSNCWTTLSSAGYHGGAMAITDGGRAENCLIFGCRSNGAGGVYISGGSLVNCIVTGCYTSDGSKQLTAYAGGVFAEYDAKVYNSVVVGNRNGLDDVTSQVKGTESYFFNNAMDFAWGRNCVTDDPRFADALHGDWHIGRNSPLVNAGTNLIYTAESKDFEGNPRVFNFGRKSGKPDIGLYETPWGSPGMLLLVK